MLELDKSMWPFLVQDREHISNLLETPNFKGSVLLFLQTDKMSWLFFCLQIESVFLNDLSLTPCATKLLSHTLGSISFWKVLPLWTLLQSKNGLFS